MSNLYIHHEEFAHIMAEKAAETPIKSPLRIISENLKKRKTLFGRALYFDDTPDGPAVLAEMMTNHFVSLAEVVVAEFKASGVKHDEGRLIAGIDALRHAQQLFFDAILLESETVPVNRAVARSPPTTATPTSPSYSKTD